MDKPTFSYAYRRKPGGRLITGTIICAKFLDVTKVITEITPDDVEIVYIIQLPS